MDPLSITSAAGAIIVSCSQITFTLMQWIGRLKTIDERIQTFVNEIQSLSATQDALRKSLQQPAMVAAARSAEQNAGARLWKQVQCSLNDCETTVERLRNVLNDINQNSGTFFRRPLQTFRESLVSGDIAELRQRLLLFNSTLSLPLQMINVTLQLEEHEANADQNERLASQISTLNCFLYPRQPIHLNPCERIQRVNCSESCISRRPRSTCLPLIPTTRCRY